MTVEERNQEIRKCVKWGNIWAYVFRGAFLSLIVFVFLSFKFEEYALIFVGGWSVLWFGSMAKHDVYKERHEELTGKKW